MLWIQICTLNLDMDPKFSFTKSLFFNYKKIKAPENVFSLNGEFLSSILHLLPLIYSIFTMCGSGSVYQRRVRIRVQKVAEYGSKLDPDPQHCYLGILFLNLFIGFYFIIHTVLQCDLPSMLVMATSFKILGGLLCYGYILLAI